MSNIWVDISLAVVTFAALVVALFQERIKKFWNKAVLDMEINLVPPDSHQIALTNPTTGEIVGQAIYIRIKVIHKKGSAGENVEIIPLNFWRVSNENILSTLKHFLPISLVWSHFQPKGNIMRVPVGLFRHCDFGYFSQSRKDGKQAILRLDTLVQPNPVAGGEIPNIIKPSKYQFELLLSGDNVKALKKRWEIEFDTWSDSENEMLEKHVKLKELF